MPRIDRSQFLREIKEHWPELRNPINAEQGLLHFEIRVVRRFVQQLIDSGMQPEIEECLAFIERCYRAGDARIRNAIDVSFVEELEFESTKKLDRRWALGVLPATLKDLYINFHGEPYWQKLHKVKK